MDPVVTGIYDPIESTVNDTLGALGLPSPLSVDVNGLLTTAAAGGDIGLNVIASDGTLVGPSDECNAQADSYTLDTPAGISIGGNAVTGLGATGEEAQAGEIDSIAIGNNAATDATATGAIALGTDATVGANSIGSVALGTGSLVTAANSVALGADSIAARGAQANYVAPLLVGLQNSAGEVSVGASGAERQITNVAAGSAPTDAANLAQVQAVAALIPTDVVQYDDGTHATITLDGAAGTTIGNVAAGAVTATSTDAVNGSQLYAVDQQVQANTTDITNLQTDLGNVQVNVTNLQTDIGGIQTDITNVQTDITNLQTNFTTLQTQVDNISLGADGPVQYSNPGTPTTPNGGTATNDVTIVSGGAGPVRVHNVAAGTVAAGSTDAVNGGQLYLTNVAAAAAQDTADEALDLANNSVQYDGPDHSSVTLGNAGTPVGLHNVAAGTAGTDAVNLDQLNDVADNAVTRSNHYTDVRLQQVNFDLRSARREARAGSAAALAAAGMPQASDPGRSMVAAGFGTYRGRTALAIGASHRTDNGQTVLKLGVTYDSSEHVGANGGVGFQF
ncbi:YadA family autotransporter adhesin [Sphingomonas sp. URHD0057]|uniref:YadA family autotransporter adhesin n=1 Tax=Sphingomonas sp. URHD0057 TaxID=1380389 RepID=UPI000491D87B|nr:YadA-like family protein [Sphingomonas sp. URHD0057]